jgi:hypothetical protein
LCFAPTELDPPSIFSVLHAFRQHRNLYMSYKITRCWVRLVIDSSESDLVLLPAGQTLPAILTKLEVHSGGVTWRNINTPPGPF